MKKIAYLMILAGLLLLNACQAARGAGQPFTPIQATPVFPENATPTSPQPVSTIAESPTGSNEQVVQLSVAALSKTLHISVNQVQVLKVTFVVWNDASLGCPKPGIDYIQVETPGYRISLQAEGKLYEYHTDRNIHVLQCDSLK
jgi:hypothetical protein